MFTEQLELIDFTNNKVAKLKELEQIIDSNIHLKSTIKSYDNVLKNNINIEAVLFTPVDRWGEKSNYVRLSIGSTFTAKVDNTLISNLKMGITKPYKHSDQYDFHLDDLNNLANLIIKKLESLNVIIPNNSNF